MADWDDDDFDPEAGFNQPQVSDRWEGEDEEEDVKDTWEDSDDEKKEETPAGGKSETTTGNQETSTAFQVKKKKNTVEQAIKRKEDQRKQASEAESEKAPVEMTPEEQLAEKLRQQKLVEDADFELTKEAFGVTDERQTTIDSMNPSTDEEFAEFGKMLKEKLAKLESSPNYVALLDDVFQACCLSLDAEQVKRIGGSLTAIGNEKAKAQKIAKGKKAKSKKAVLAGSGKSSRKDDIDTNYEYGDEFADFM